MMDKIVEAARRAMAWDESEDFESGWARILYYAFGTVVLGCFLLFIVALVGIFGSY